MHLPNSDQKKNSGEKTGEMTDCPTAMQAARRECHGKTNSALDACMRGHNLTRESVDPRNEVVCVIDGTTRPWYLPYPDGGGQHQKVLGHFVHGAPSRFAA